MFSENRSKNRTTMQYDISMCFYFRKFWHSLCMEMCVCGVLNYTHLIYIKIVVNQRMQNQNLIWLNYQMLWQCLTMLGYGCCVSSICDVWISLHCRVIKMLVSHLGFYAENAYLFTPLIWNWYQCLCIRLRLCTYVPNSYVCFDHQLQNLRYFQEYLPCELFVSFCSKSLNCYGKVLR